MSEGPKGRFLVDTNILVRFLTGDDPPKAEACKDLFEKAGRNEVELYINELAVAELAWVLRSSYRLERQEIAAALRDAIRLPGLRLERRHVLAEAVELYHQLNVDFSDALHAADLRARGLDGVCSYDAHFDRLGVVRVAPGER